VIPALVEALGDRFFDVRAAAAIALGKAGDAKVLPHLVGALSDTHQQVSESASLAIGILGEREGLPVLRDLLLDTVEGRKLVRRPQGVPVRTRAFAAIGMGLVGDRHAVADLLFVADPARREASKDVPIGAIVGLGLLGSEASDAVAPLLDLLANPRIEDLVRSYAATSLGKIGDPAAVPALRRALRDSSLHVARSAVLALGRLSPEEDSITATLLADIVEKGRDPQARNWACISLARIGGPTAEKSLKRVATGSSSTLRAFGALGLAILHRRAGGIDGAERYLRAGLAEGGDQSVQGAFAIALGLVRDPEAVPDLVRLMVGQNSPALRGYAAVALGMLGARESIPEIRALASARVLDPELQRAAATALGLMGDPQAVDLLVGVIRSAKTEFVMSSAAIALGQIGDHTAVDTLIALLRDEENVPDLARAQATVALGVVAEDEKLPVLHAVSADSNYRALVESIQEVLTIQ
jgi:HEAT repeat protein